MVMCLERSLRYLHPRGPDHIEGSDHSRDKVDHFSEALFSDAPGPVDEEHQVGFSSFTNCGTIKLKGFLISLSL